MKITEQLEADIEMFFQNIEKQLPEARKTTLKLLLDKYIHLFSTPIMLDKHDLDLIKDQAHSFFINTSFPRYVGENKRQIPHSDVHVLSIVEGTISILNHKDCFKKLPKIDYRD